MAAEKEAEKLFALAEARFLASDVAGAVRAARQAQRLFRPLPGIADALAAYEVHAAGRGNWYAVLEAGGGWLRTSSGDCDAVRQRYRRLCLALHPDKNRSAAADGAFKLLQQAWEALSAPNPPPVPPPADVKPSPSPPQQHKTDQWKQKKAAGCYCHRCDAWTADTADEDGIVKCGRCGVLLWFPCPAECRRCGMPRAYVWPRQVRRGTWHLKCVACHRYALLNVRSADDAAEWCKLY